MNGGSRVAEVLKANGVPVLFALCGGHISPILVESRRRGIRVVDTRSEVNAVFAADSMARLTGIPGVAAVTAGPGVTNSITAIKNAQLAQSPLVLLGGATATMLRGRGSLQDIDQMALIEPHVKWAGRPNNLRDVVPALEKAFRVARDGVPGPVFVEIAIDLLYEESTVRSWYKAKTDKKDKKLIEHAQSMYIKGHLTYLFTGTDSPAISPPRYATPRAPQADQIQTAAKAIAAAQKPIMVIGSQAMLHPERVDELVAAVERIGVPVYLSGMARGLLGTGHPLHMRHKRRDALRESDLAILCGVPCDFRLDYGSHVSRSHVIGVNLSRDDLNKNRRPDTGVLADPHTFLTMVSRALSADPAQRTLWLATLGERDRARENEIDSMASQSVQYINPLSLCRAIDESLSDNSIVVGDGGDFVATASYIVKPRKPYSWLDPGVFGTLGVGAGFAMGAKLVRPDADVWLLYGDGAAGFSIMEFDTFARHGIPVIAVVGNDAGWTQIARDQVEILGEDTGCTLTHMAYHKVAEGCGGVGIEIRESGEIKDALARAVDHARKGSPVLLNALVGKTEFRKGSISM
ncbi:MAG: thiamine pyrophosphate-dependent enzyme [Proteobacteria bacterium]|nr:thiamine pyrophosphate-dependent enzyme [Pseudomonadota bacterium]